MYHKNRKKKECVKICPQSGSFGSIGWGRGALIQKRREENKNKGKKWRKIR